MKLFKENKQAVKEIMETGQLKQTCKQCRTPGFGNYCNMCGQSYNTHKITLGGIFHEVFHFFTHLDKGFPYTLKKLAVAPGKMQREYLLGHRHKYQKPFSMFFLCASITAFALYLINKPSGHELSHSEIMREDFMRHYYVLLQSALIPFYAALTWILFRNNRINYAESLVVFLYTSSFTLLVVIFVNLASLLSNNISMPWLEIPVLLIYVIWTNLNLFVHENKVWVVVKTAINIVACYFLFRFSASLVLSVI